MPKPTVWTYNSYRASLYRKGKCFAIVTPDGINALSPEAAQLLLDSLNRPALPAALSADLKSAIETAIISFAEQERSVPRTFVQLASIRETKLILRKALTHL